MHSGSENYSYVYFLAILEKLVLHHEAVSKFAFLHLYWTPVFELEVGRV